MSAHNRRKGITLRGLILLASYISVQEWRHHDASNQPSPDIYYLVVVVVVRVHPTEWNHSHVTVANSPQHQRVQHSSTVLRGGPPHEQISELGFGPLLQMWIEQTHQTEAE